MSKKTRAQLLFVIFAFFICMTCTNPSGSDSDDGSAVSDMLELGETVHLVSSSIGASGGVIEVQNENDPMNGLTITVPEDAYSGSVNFSVSYQPVMNHKLGEDYKLCSPLLEIDNGENFAKIPIAIKIPVNVPLDTMALMAFYYNKSTGAFEGIPIIDYDSTSVIVSTCHFSGLTIISPEYPLWKIWTESDKSTNFHVMEDNWGFKNLGTCLSAGGICSGMTLSSLYYYSEYKTKQGAPNLFNRYDNNGITPGTANFTKDDAHAIKLCSSAQYYFSNFIHQSINYWLNSGNNWGDERDFWTFFMSANSIAIMNEPHIIFVYNTAEKSGHALIVYKKEGTTLYIADPNYPLEKISNLNSISARDISNPT